MWSDEFYIGIRGQGVVELLGRLLASNRTGPQEFTLLIDAEVTETEMMVNELVAFPDPVDED